MMMKLNVSLSMKVEYYVMMTEKLQKPLCYEITFQKNPGVLRYFCIQYQSACSSLCAQLLSIFSTS